MGCALTRSFCHRRGVVASWKCYPSNFDMSGDRIGRQLSLATKRELIQAISARYHSSTHSEKQKILDEFTEVTGFHRVDIWPALLQQSRRAPLR